jgi:hypothetical protein
MEFSPYGPVNAVEEAASCSVLVLMLALTCLDIRFSNSGRLLYRLCQIGQI